MVRARFAVITVIIFFLSIAGLRFYASNLEQQVINLTRSTDEINAREMSLKQELAALVSPNRIYNYCKDVLGMKRAVDIVVINGK